MTAPAFDRWIVWRGNDVARSFRFRDAAGPVDLTGIAVVVRLAWTGGALDLRSGVDAAVQVADQAQAGTRGLVTIALSRQQTRALPTEEAARWEIELRSPALGERTWVWGEVIAEGGDNTDG